MVVGSACSFICDAGYFKGCGYVEHFDKLLKLGGKRCRNLLIRCILFLLIACQFTMLVCLMFVKESLYSNCNLPMLGPHSFLFALELYEFNSQRF